MIHIIGVDDLVNVFTDPTATEHMSQAAPIAQSYDPHLHVVRSSHHAGQDTAP